jgi:hypothetical protein
LPLFFVLPAFFLDRICDNFGYEVGVVNNRHIGIVYDWEIKSIWVGCPSVTRFSCRVFLKGTDM